MKYNNTLTRQKIRKEKKRNRTEQKSEREEPMSMKWKGDTTDAELPKRVFGARDNFHISKKDKAERIGQRFERSRNNGRTKYCTRTKERIGQNYVMTRRKDRTELGQNKKKG